MVDGLKVTIAGEELRELLAKRANEHRDQGRWWKSQSARAGEEQTEEASLLPEQMCDNEAEREEWRAAVLTFLREHLEPLEVYRLGHSDLEFAELLPPKPGNLEQEEYEERTAVGFQLGRLAKRVQLGPEIVYVTNPDDSER